MVCVVAVAVSAPVDVASDAASIPVDVSADAVSVPVDDAADAESILVGVADAVPSPIAICAVDLARSRMCSPPSP